MVAPPEANPTKNDPAIPSGLSGKYRIQARVGEGGMGVVLSGDHLELGTKVAIKVLQPSLAEDPVARARFLREARLAASIQGEHSTRIHDVGSDQAGRPYMVMEFLAGESVDRRLLRERKMRVADAATVVVQLLDALAEAHAKGLVHRDLKPANLFLVDRPGEPIFVKVLDFGISKPTTEGRDAAQESSAAGITAPRTLLGSPAYMSPEQLRASATIDPRSDLWACGVILFELLTGTVPFEGATLPELYAQILGGEPKSFAELGAEAPPSPIARIIERCLMKDPRSRPKDAYEVARVLAPYANESSLALLPRIGAWCKSHDVSRPGETRSRRGLMGGVGLVTVSGALAFTLASLRGASEPMPSATAAPLAAVSLTPVPSTAAAFPEPPPSASGVAPRPSSSSLREVPPSKGVGLPAPRPSGNPPKNRSPRIGDLDGIELIP